MNAGAPITVFEVITAAAFRLFAADPADLCILEVGLGGRGDATNVIDRPAVCAITSISIDHRDFLGDSLSGIAAEKAGIIKPGVPVVTGVQAPEVLAVIAEQAVRQGARLFARNRDWTIEPASDGLRFADAGGEVPLPWPSLAGAHQHDNAGIAVAGLRASGLALLRRMLSPAGVARAEWPGRMQRLGDPLAATLPEGWELWLDGAHNPGRGVKRWRATWRAGWTGRFTLWSA